MTDIIEVLKAARAPNKRGFWHREARQMKASGNTIHEIAEAFGKSGNAVKAATRGVKAVASHRPLYKATVNGVSTGKLKRVAIAFSNEQLAAINIIAQERQLSFSKIVSDLVDLAIEEIIS